MNTPEQRRALALDALRGIAILLMIFSGRIPFGVLPDWMYHAQISPPAHKFDPTLPGITWVDLVFPFFLFAMGAAIPLALSRKLDQRVSLRKMIAGIATRGLLLAAFAIYVQHIRPWGMSATPDAWIWVQCLAGFLLLFPMIARLPESWSPAAKWGTRIIGWGGAVALMAIVRFADGSGFSVKRSDIIILVLSNVAVAGSIIWLFTRHNFMPRIVILGVLLGLRLAAAHEGWVQWLWNISPVPWLFQVRFLQYLFIVVPGTIIGDLLLRWMNDIDSPAASNWNAVRWWALCAIGLSLNVFVTIGLNERYVEVTLALSLLLALCAWWIVQRPSTATERLLRDIIPVGITLLLIGFVFEPYEGGIKKDHATVSYYFVTGGLAVLLLAALTAVVDVFKKKQLLGILIGSGQNPLVAYAGVNSFLTPILGLVGLDSIIASLTAEPWLGVLRGAVMTLLVALVAVFCTNKKIFLRM